MKSKEIKGLQEAVLYLMSRLCGHALGVHDIEILHKLLYQKSLKPKKRKSK